MHFSIRMPKAQTVPFVFNSPHSGRRYTKAFRAQSRLDETQLRQSEDAFVDELFADVPALGAPLMLAHFPRAWLDVNREPRELDPALFDGKLPKSAYQNSPRVAAGLGIIAKIVKEGQPIYKGKLPLEEGLERIEKVYRPYHAALENLIGQTARKFGGAILIDCHSMPDERGKSLPDIIIGDRYGTSCRPHLIRELIALFRARGYRAGRNNPYAGGFITEHYGQPSQGVHALQIEINRALYMDEKTIAPLPEFGRLKRDLTEIFAQIVQSARDEAQAAQ